MKRRFAKWVVAAAAILVFANNGMGQGVRQATVSEMKGNVQVRIQGGEWQAAEVGMVLQEKDEIRTVEGSSAELLLDEGTSTGKIELLEKSHLKLSQMTVDGVTGEKTTALDLALGKVLVHAEKLQGDSKFQVKTPTSIAGVKGTVFEVSVEEEKDRQPS